ncbi:competence/damage-inducible protein A [Jeotgalibacillus sp. R-1-5s-1]|uniref:competence/damage-inducible protein A n=1 Tax=Jeotgalibacillus sp. R-1-5s-1 TaxID=2555897 RepID=UPI00106AD569|nr:competence/damage-inducible protein A [Jeotgalibacillus sp. R-1-5s-1]TFE03430.1 competence/damage-inducible protein A [Jeotgalibacillus sp. R-1-5s-1]
MNAEIIAVGSELLLGQIANTNAQFISARFAEAGIGVFRHSVIGDNTERLTDELNAARSRSDLIIMTGGLGPTKDDLTKETAASILDRKLVYDQSSLDYIEQYFRSAGRAMTDNNRKQALVIEGSKVLFNHHGMAPGMVIEDGQSTIVLLPGPPREMKPMLTDQLLPYLLKKRSGSTTIHSKVLRFFGIGEAELETMVEDLMNGTNPTVAPLASDGEVTLRLTAAEETLEKAVTLVDQVEETIRNRPCGDYIYGYDDESLTVKAAALLKQKKLSISSAESLTAGLFASELATVAGISSSLQGSAVVYSPDAKQSVLNVSSETISVHGTVSQQCAEEMAANVMRLYNTDIGISFTGVAGPGPFEGKEEGTVWLSIASRDGSLYSKQLKLQGERNFKRIRAVKHGLFELIRFIHA